MPRVAALFKLCVFIIDPRAGQGPGIGCDLGHRGGSAMALRLGFEFSGQNALSKSPDPRYILADFNSLRRHASWCGRQNASP